ncbi:nucleolar 14 [Brachionus plicatilis]|uniref:Nucleolar 14 n=1 Tax=Brachionus plicatilis TaxID=10195 RepID=A0A3M7SA24_BRAPC|nr:nucleolar 14 [Brachionus plicatilis]
MSFKAHDKRVKTLLVEYKNQFKGNAFNDKRIGENDKNMSLEDKMFKRFVAERQKSRKINKFNLNDDEFDNPSNKVELTHYGQNLSQIERFERVQLSDDDEVDENDPDKGKINAEFVSKNFFGGFNENSEDLEGKKKNRKEWIEEMITKSKMLKYEKQKEKDRTLDMTEELDKEWKNIIPLIGKMSRDLKKEEEQKKTKADEYDVLVRSLQFESEKAQPTNKSKTSEEIEKERVESLSKNERELKERMNREVEESLEEDLKQKKSFLKKTPANHISPDDIEFDDPEYLEMFRRQEVAMKNKKLNEELEKKAKEEEQDESENEQTGDSDKEEVEELISEKDFGDENESVQKSNFSEYKNEKWVKEFENVCLKMDQKSIDCSQFDAFLKSLIQKLDPSRDENNKKRLCLLTEYLISYYQSMFRFKSPSNISIDSNLANLLTNYIFDFIYKYGNKSTKKDPSPYIALFKRILDNLNKDYLNLKINERKIPQLDILFTFKLISSIFPTSDFRHQIITPCLLIMARYLIQSQIQNIGDLFRGLFLCNLCYEFVSKSKRYIPECVQFLNGALYLAANINSKNINQNLSLSNFELSTIFESFKRTKLRLSIIQKSDDLTELSLTKTSLDEKIQTDDSTKAAIISYVIDLLTSFAKIYQEMVSFKEIFSLSKKILDCINTDNNPTELKERISKIAEFIDQINLNPRQHLKCLIKKPVASKLHEPKIQSKTKFDPRHHNSLTSEKQLFAKKYKKELKSAIKEIRHDSQFLARVQLKEQLEKDAKRTQKVKEIMGSLANQEGDYQKVKRQKI